VFAAETVEAYAGRSTTVPAFEVANHRDVSRITEFGIYKGGRIKQGNADVGTVFTLNAGQTSSSIPATLPPGTLIVRKTV
jgi:hypothetical protein